MTPEVTIRPYADRDHESVTTVLHDLQQSERLLFSRMRTPEDLPSDYIHAIKEEAEKAGGCILVAELGGEVVGYCSLLTRCDSSEELDETYFEYAYIGDLAVLHDRRSLGIGAKLIAACEERCRAAGINWLRLSVLAANDRARKFYALQGFSENLILLEKKL